MADRKETISQQPAATTLDGSEVFPLVQGGATKKIRADILSPAMSVKWFGARGDGVTNDTGAIQTGLTTCASRGVSLYFPAGTYMHDAALTMPSGVTIYGDGPRSIIKANTLDFAAGAGSHRQIHASGVSNFVIRDLTLDASGMASFLGGMRSIFLMNCSTFWIERVKFITPGAATAAIGCSRYEVSSCDITCSATDGVTHHDGIIDQWGGSHDFKVTRNRIDGAGIFRYGILVTGEDTAGFAAPCYDFVISANKILNGKSIGIWVNGREGPNYNFQVSGNTVDTIADFFGIALSDCRDGVLSDNVTNSTARNGIRLYSETTEGGALGVLNVTCHGNVVRSANTSLSANDLEGAAFAVASPSADNVISGTRVVGAAHRNGIYFQPGSLRNRELGSRIDAGVLSTKVGDSSRANYPAFGTYVPTLTGVANVASTIAYQANYTVDGEGLVTVYLKLSVTPTAASSTATQVGISLPVASNLANADVDLHGTGTSAFGLVGAIGPDLTNDRAQLQFPAPNTSANSVFATFRYRVL